MEKSNRNVTRPDPGGQDEILREIHALHQDRLGANAEREEVLWGMIKEKKRQLARLGRN